MRSAGLSASKVLEPYAVAELKKFSSVVETGDHHLDWPRWCSLSRQSATPLIVQYPYLLPSSVWLVGPTAPEIASISSTASESDSKTFSMFTGSLDLDSTGSPWLDRARLMPHLAFARKIDASLSPRPRASDTCRVVSPKQLRN